LSKIKCEIWAKNEENYEGLALLLCQFWHQVGLFETRSTLRPQSAYCGKPPAAVKTFSH